MHKTPLSVLLSASLLLAACGTSPNTYLETARSELEQARANPSVVANAPRELDEANTAFRQAEEAWKDDKDEQRVNDLAYLALQRTHIASERAAQVDAEKQVETMTAERDRARLQARTTEADQAKQRAAQAEAQAQSARQQATEAQASSQDAQARAAALEAELRALHAKSTDRGMVVTLGDVLFDTGKSTLKPGSRRNIEQVAQALKNTGGRKIVIEGHTDSRGSDERNQRLSEERAAAVREALVGLGVDAASIRTAGYGERYPVANNRTTAGRQLNRRVEIVISKDEQDVQPRQ